MEYGLLLCAVALSKVFAYKCIEGRKLTETAGGPVAPFRMATEELARLLGGNREIARQIKEPSLLEWAGDELEWCGEYGIRALYIDDPEYPSRLRECCDAPLVLYCKGGISLNPERALAVVGTRKASYTGKSACIRAVRDLSHLAPAPVIVSGLAFGIDATAHQAALDSGLKTIAVIPCGLDTIYPSSHRDLAVRIVRDGALVTDFPRCTYPQVAHFIRRNRIIAGMADATLVAESYDKGGSLITASLANCYDREVMAFPGRVSDQSFAGCNSLIAANQARLVTGGSGIAAAMGWEMEKRGSRTSGGTLPFPEEDDRGKILALLRRESPLDFERIMEITGLPFKTLTTILLELELNGSIVSVQGRKYAPAP